MEHDNVLKKGDIDGQDSIDTDSGDEDMEKNNERYSKKSQLTAFLLSLFLGIFAIGRFYAGSYVSASCKLLLNLIVTAFKCVPACLGLEQFLHKKFRMVVVILFYILIAWFVADLVFFANNIITDQNGLRLQPW